MLSIVGLTEEWGLCLFTTAIIATKLLLLRPKMYTKVAQSMPIPETTREILWSCFRCARLSGPCTTSTVQLSLLEVLKSSSSNVVSLICNWKERHCKTNALVPVAVCKVGLVSASLQPSPIFHHSEDRVTPATKRWVYGVPSICHVLLNPLAFWSKLPP